MPPESPVDRVPRPALLVVAAAAVLAVVVTVSTLLGGWAGRAVAAERGAGKAAAPVEARPPRAAAATPPASVTTSPAPPASATTSPSPTAAAAPSTTAVPASWSSCAVQAELSAAAGVARANGVRGAAAVLDTSTGAYLAAGDADAPYPTASVVKVLIATQLLLTGRMTEQTATTARQMITTSDDSDADALYGAAGGDALVPTLAARYGIADLGSPPAETGQWGETMVTADGLAHLYAALRADPVVWPWLGSAMGAMADTADDGTDQDFGIPAAAASWSVKQGWMVGLGPGATWNSTGYVQDDRYVVVLLAHSADPGDYDGLLTTTVTGMARALLPPAGLGTGPCS